MAHVELLGAPGSGKSTIARALGEAWPGALMLDQAVHRAVKEHGGRIARTAARVSGPSGRVWRSAYGRSSDRRAAMSRFASSHPELVEVVAAAQLDRRQRDRGQDLVRAWIDGFFARYQLATEAAIGPLIVDEGFAQRAVALFGFGYGPADSPYLDRFLAAIPIPSAVASVATSLETCAARLNARGWSERVADLGPDAREEFLQTTHGLVDEISARLDDMSVTVIRLDGTRSPAESASKVLLKLTPDAT